jgi:hypothetical protein
LVEKREMADQCPYLKKLASLNSEKRNGSSANKTVAEGRLLQLLEGIKNRFTIENLLQTLRY